MSNRDAVFSGGRRMYDLRKANKWEQNYIEQWTREHFGEEGVISVPQVSKYENGSVKRIAFADAVHWGQVFGLSPNDMANIFGLWHEPAKEPEDPLVSEIAELLKSLDPEQQERFRADLEHEIWRNKAEAMRHARTNIPRSKHSTEPPAVGSRR